ncbi:MAG: glutamine synthetase, partial [Lentimonas sp.]
MEGLFDINLSLNRQTLLLRTLEKFYSINLQPKIGVELEFYLRHQNKPTSPQRTEKFISKLRPEIAKHNIYIQGIELEQGSGQIEIKTLPYLDIAKLCQDIEKIRKIIINLNDDLQVDFSSQPYMNDCGNALQINFSLMKNSDYLFSKNDNTESEYLLHCISGILNNVKNMMIIFAPEGQDYQRFDLKLNRNLHKKQKFTAPVNISWGYDNRTSLVRIPKTNRIDDRRLEFRLASNAADIYLAMSFFLLAISEGLEQKIEAPKEIYGNAFDEQYGLEILPNYEEAKGCFD